MDLDQQSNQSEPFQAIHDGEKHPTVDDFQTSFLDKSSDVVNTTFETLIDDPVLLRVAIRRCRLDCAEAERRIRKLKEDHQDFVPKDDFLRLQQSHEELSQMSEQLKQNFRNAKVEYNALVEALETLIKDRDKYFHLCENYRATLTPRPNWERCATVVEGGLERWNELTIGKTSNERVDILLNEIIGGNDIYNNVTHFLGLGLDSNVPTFLQTTARISNRHFMQRDVLLLIEDIWKQKIQYDAEHAESVPARRSSSSRTQLHSAHGKHDMIKPIRRISLADFIHIYLKRRFPDDEILQLEWGYNLVASCRRFQFSPEIRLFWNILRGHIDEDVYHQNRLSTTEE